MSLISFSWSLNLIFCLVRLLKHFLFLCNVLFWSRRLREFLIISSVVVSTLSSSWNTEDYDDLSVSWSDVWLFVIRLFISSKHILLLVVLCHEYRNFILQMSLILNSMLSSVACHLVLTVVVLHQLHNSKHLYSQCLIVSNQSWLAYLRFWIVF